MTARQSKPAPETAEVPIPQQSDNGQGPPPEVTYNPLDLSRLRSRSTVLAGVTRKPKRIPVLNTPEANSFVRVRHGAEYQATIDLVVAKNASGSSDRKPLYVAGNEDVEEELERFIRPHKIRLAITKHDRVYFVWARQELNGENSWTDSMFRAMQDAEDAWVSIEADQVLSEYTTHVSPNTDRWGEPKWPDYSLQDTIDIAFKDRIIDSLDGAVARRLLGLD